MQLVAQEERHFDINDMHDVGADDDDDDTVFSSGLLHTDQSHHAEQNAEKIPLLRDDVIKAASATAIN